MSIKAKISIATLLIIIALLLTWWIISLDDKENESGLSTNTNVIKSKNTIAQKASTPTLDLINENQVREAINPTETEDDFSYRITGTVFDSVSNALIADFEISCKEQLRIKGKIRIGDQVTRNIKSHDGKFQFEIKKPGYHHLFVQARGYKKWHKPMKIEESDLIDIVIRLKKPIGISGQVVSRFTRNPVEKANITCLNSGSKYRDKEGNIIRTGTGITQKTAVTDSNGYFRIHDLSDRLYLIRAIHEDYATTTIEAMAGTDDLIIPMQEGHYIFGTVHDDNGIPARGIKINLQRNDGVKCGTYYSDDKGKYKTTPLKPCNLRISAEEPRKYNKPGSTFTEEGYRIKIEHMDLEVNFGPSIGHVTWMGTLYDWNGKPIPSGKIRIWNDLFIRTIEKPRIEEGFSADRVKKCDLEGRFEIRKLQPGSYFVDMCKKGESLQRFNGYREQFTFDVPGEHLLDLHFRRTKISGVVIDDKTGRPYKGYNGSVLIHGVGGVHIFNLKNKNEFCWVGLPPGTYFLGAHSRYRVTPEPVKINLTENCVIENIEIHLTLGGRLRVRIEDIENGENIIIKMKVLHPDGTRSSALGGGFRAKDGTKGIWECVSIHQPGTWTIVIKEDSLGEIRRDYVIHQNKTTEVIVSAKDFKKIELDQELLEEEK